MYFLPFFIIDYLLSLPPINPRKKYEKKIINTSCIIVGGIHNK